MKFTQIIILSTFLFLVFLSFCKPVTAWTQDLGRHLTVGEIILSTMSVPKENLFSYTYPHFPFINSHWFSEILFTLLYRGGEMLLLVTMSLVGTAAVGILFLFCVKRYGLPSSPLLIAVGILYMHVLQERTDLRPELFSFLFTSIFLTLLYSYREQYTKKILFLVPLTILWVNTHIYFLIGILLLTLFFIDSLWQRRQHIMGKRLPKETKLLLFTLIAAICSTLLNPNGITGALYPLTVMDNYGYSIQENQHVFFLWEYGHSSTILFFFFSLIVVVLSFLCNAKKSRAIDLILASLFSLLAMSAIRHFPLFVLTTYPLVIYNMWSYIKKQAYSKYLTTFPIYGAIILLLSWHGITQVQKNATLSAIGPQPAAAFFIKEQLQGPLFNNFDIGSYLIYSLYPQEHVFVDGRPEAYPASFFQDIYIPIQQDPQLFKKMSDRYSFNTIIFAHTDQTPWAISFLSSIVDDPLWRMIYLDDYAVIFIKESDRNAALLYRFPKKGTEIPLAKTTDLGRRQSLLSLASFFQKAGWVDREKEMFQRILALHPTDCTALYYLGSLTKEQNELAIYSQKYQTWCK